MVKFLKENFVYSFITRGLPDMEISNVEYIGTFGDHLIVDLDNPTMNYKTLFDNFYNFIVVQHGQYVTKRNLLDPKYESIVIVPSNGTMFLDTYRVLPSWHP